MASKNFREYGLKLKVFIAFKIRIVLFLNFYLLINAVKALIREASERHHCSKLLWPGRLRPAKPSGVALLSKPIVILFKFLLIWLTASSEKLIMGVGSRKPIIYNFLLGL